MQRVLRELYREFLVKFYAKLYAELYVKFLVKFLVDRAELLVAFSKVLGKALYKDLCKASSKVFLYFF